MQNTTDRVDAQDSEWISEPLTGNRGSFDRIVLKYQEPVYNLIAGTIRNQAAAEEKSSFTAEENIFQPDSGR